MKAIYSYYVEKTTISITILVLLPKTTSKEAKGLHGLVTSSLVIPVRPIAAIWLPATSPQPLAAYQDLMFASLLSSRPPAAQLDTCYSNYLYAGV